MAERRRIVLIGGTGLVVFLISTALAWDENIPGWELDLFEWINGWPDWLAVPLWPVMQFGMVIAPFVAAGIAWFITRRWHPAAGLAVGGFVVWLLAKVVKEIVARPRPGGLLEDVSYRVDGGPSGLGYISGHAAVGFTIAFVAAAYLPRRWAVTLFSLAAAAGTLRVYVGAHLPLDSIGGAGFGLTAGALVLLLTRRG